jgi:hypothetical protein
MTLGSFTPLKVCTLTAACLFLSSLGRSASISIVDYVQDINGNQLCTANPHQGRNSDGDPGIVFASNGCGYSLTNLDHSMASYTGFYSNAVVVGAVGGLGGPAINEASGLNIGGVPGKPLGTNVLTVDMGGGWGVDWTNPYSYPVVVSQTYHLNASVLSDGTNPGSSYFVDAIGGWTGLGTCVIGDGRTTLSGDCTATAILPAGHTVTESGSVRTLVSLTPSTASGSFTMTLDPSAPLMMVTATSVTDLNGNPLPLGGLVSGVVLTPNGYASESALLAPESQPVTMIGLGTILLCACMWLRQRVNASYFSRGMYQG